MRSPAPARFVIIGHKYSRLIKILHTEQILWNPYAGRRMIFFSQDTMSTTGPSRIEPEPDFTRRSSTESICMWCYLTVRAIKPELLEIEERIHSSSCIQRPDGPFRKPTA